FGPSISNMYVCAALSATAALGTSVSAAARPSTSRISRFILSLPFCRTLAAETIYATCADLVNLRRKDERGSSRLQKRDEAWLELAPAGALRLALTTRRLPHFADAIRAQPCLVSPMDHQPERMTDARGGSRAAHVCCHRQR